MVILETSSNEVSSYGLYLIRLMVETSIHNDTLVTLHPMYDFLIYSFLSTGVECTKICRLETSFKNHHPHFSQERKERHSLEKTHSENFPSPLTKPVGSSGFISSGCMYIITYIYMWVRYEVGKWACYNSKSNTKQGHKDTGMKKERQRDRESPGGSWFRSRWALFLDLQVIGELN